MYVTNASHEENLYRQDFEGKKLLVKDKSRNQVFSKINLKLLNKKGQDYQTFWVQEIRNLKNPNSQKTKVSLTYQGTAKPTIKFNKG